VLGEEPADQSDFRVFRSSSGSVMGNTVGKLRSTPKVRGSRRFGPPVTADKATRWEGRTLSTKGEREGLDAGTGELDLERSIDDGPGLTNQLIQPLFGDLAGAGAVDVGAVGDPRRLSINRHAKRHRGSGPGRSHDQMKVARMKAVADPPPVTA
jgi:hypothetical protein